MLTVAMVVVELFTSQGCSSCPPADALLALLDRDPNVLVLSEHVDYWNYLGWRDPYSSSAFSQRQRSYARKFGLDGPYTPQMVVDGRKQFVGSDLRSAREAIIAADERPKTPLVLAREGRRVRVTVPPLTAGKSAELWVAILLPDGAVDVSRGENTGRRLRHVGIVKSLTKAGATHRQNATIHSIELPPDESGPWRIIGFLQEPGFGAIVGAGRL